MLLFGVSTRRLTDGEAIVDVPPMVGRNVDRLDAARLDRVDKLEHALDLGPAIGAQQDVAAGAHTRQGLAALACADGADDVEARSRCAVVVRRPAPEGEYAVRDEWDAAASPVEDLFGRLAANP